MVEACAGLNCYCNSSLTPEMNEQLGSNGNTSGLYLRGTWLNQDRTLTILNDLLKVLLSLSRQMSG
jgi:hypothetical protein